MVFIKPRFTLWVVQTGTASFHYSTENSQFPDMILWQFPFQTQSQDALQEVNMIFRKKTPKFYTNKLFFTLKYSMPVPTIDWGWFLS